MFQPTNVIRCAPNHWKIASGEGCDHCDCDPIGSTNETCNEYSGQCECKPGFGGRRCDQCEENYWGDPQVECYPCNCNPQGSKSYQCDHKTGKCVCLEGEKVFQSHIKSHFHLFHKKYIYLRDFFSALFHSPSLLPLFSNIYLHVVYKYWCWICPSLA